MYTYEWKGHKIIANNIDQLNKQVRVLKAKIEKEEEERDLRNNRVDKRTVSG